jgi:hypothetical protein
MHWKSGCSSSEVRVEFTGDTETIHRRYGMFHCRFGRPALKVRGKCTGCTESKRAFDLVACLDLGKCI